jgi:hypothetical protein
MALRQDRDSADWFFLAMLHCQLGKKDMARKRQGRAVQWIDDNKQALEKRPSDLEELRRFRAETLELLGISKQPLPDNWKGGQRSRINRVRSTIQVLCKPLLAPTRKAHRPDVWTLDRRPPCCAESRNPTAALDRGRCHGDALRCREDS